MMILLVKELSPKFLSKVAQDLDLVSIKYNLRIIGQRSYQA